MQHNSLFQTTRWRLACWYAGITGLMLSACGLIVYELVSYTRWQVVDQDLESMARALHDGLEPHLQQPGRIAPTVQNLLPGTCLEGERCMEQAENSERQPLGALHSAGYYARFLDRAGRVVGTVGVLPEKTSAQIRSNTVPQWSIDSGLLNCSHGCAKKRVWKILNTGNMGRYRQVSLLLDAAEGGDWGYLQLGKSLQEFDRFILKLRLIFLLGLPLAVVLITGTGWWLAGLAMRPVYQSYQQIQQFTADAAHELRTPLAAIRATVEATLRKQPFTLEQAHTTLQTIDRQNYRLSQLVQDLLLLSHLDLKVVAIQHHPCCLNDLINDLFEELFSLAVAADIKLDINIPQDNSIIVLGNEEQLYRLIANLVMNAIQYTPQKGEVMVRLERHEAHAVIHVHDTGSGISLDEQLRIFDRFYRIDSDRSRHTGGSGLGLAITQAIAQSHQGWVSVKSELGQGSIFSVHLPLSHNT
jgi:signal transduction histidine kinase